MKGIIYYSDNQTIEPILFIVWKQILKAGLSVTSVTLEPIDHENNFVLKNHKRGYVTMIKQIILALEKAKEDVVFFCEHDVLYHPSHFDFTPPRDDIFYYNENVWRWELRSEIAIRYNRMLPLSCLCVNRKFALKHYKIREAAIKSAGSAAFLTHEPMLARKWGYEPGTKKRKRGGLTDDDFETWKSEYPNVDIRHKGTFSPSKTKLEQFKHPPTNWQQISVDEIPYWNLRKMFNF